MVFLSYLKEYLSPRDDELLSNRLSDPNLSYGERDEILRLIRLNNFHGQIKLISYCLMPNHFHLSIQQTSAQLIDKFMNSLSLRYAVYFNHRYKRVGKLFQGVYKAVVVETDSQLLYLSSYIHRNPLPPDPEKLPSISEYLASFYSSYGDYLGLRHTKWIFPAEVLDYFSNNNPKSSYQSFVEQADDITTIQDLLLEEF